MAQRMRCAPRRDKSRLNRSLNLSFGWNHRSIPPPTAQFIAVVSLTNSGTVPEFFTAIIRDSPWVFQAKTHIGEEGAADRHRTRLAFGRKTGFDDRIVTHDWTADEHSYKLMKKSDR